MADRRTKKTAKQIFGYARLNFHMGMRQGKNLAVLGYRYNVEKIQPIDMFPHTPYVEAVVSLKRK